MFYKLYDEFILHVCILLYIFQFHDVIKFGHSNYIIQTILTAHSFCLEISN